MHKESDPLWIIAQERVKFRFQLYLFFAVTTILWFIWFSTNVWDRGVLKPSSRGASLPWTFPWPLYVMLVWGVILFLMYLKVYSKVGPLAVEEEYTKLKGKK